MQLKIIDHTKLLEAIHWPAEAKGSAVVQIVDPRNQLTNLRIEVEAGKASVKRSTGEPEFVCPERLWGPIVTGDLGASAVAELGLVRGELSAIRLLDWLSAGKKPYCGEYF